MKMIYYCPEGATDIRWEFDSALGLSVFFVKDGKNHRETVQLDVNEPFEIRPAKGGTA